MAWSSTVPATEANTGQSYLRARTSSRSLISALFLALPVGRLAGKATPPHSCSRQLMEEKRGQRFPFRSHEICIIAASVSVLPKLVAHAVSGLGATAVFEPAYTALRKSS